jgi:hypothetical protein
VNTEINVGERFYNGVTDFTQSGNILGILNLFCGFIIADIVVVIFLCMKINQKKGHLGNKKKLHGLSPLTNYTK